MKVAIIFTALFCVSCATNEPIRDVKNYDFSKPLTQLEQDHEEIAKGYIFSYPKIAIDMEELESKWNKPIKTEKKWGQRILGLGFSLGLGAADLLTWPIVAAIEVIFLPPSEISIWEKENKIIQVTSGTSLFNGYRQKAVAWEWSEKAESTVLSDAGR